MDTSIYRIDEPGKFRLADYDTSYGGSLKKKEAEEKLKKNILELQALQGRLFAEGKTGLLVIFQAMDTGGKDSAIKHVLGGLDPQGVDAISFKKPSEDELAHDYMWRVAKECPSRGKIAAFNRSYYEDVLIAKVHKLYEGYNLPERCKTEDTIDKRYGHIRHFEDYLWDNGIVTVKFFLHLSKDVQRKRFLERIERKDKNWKFQSGDIEERQFWDEYQEAYEAAIQETAAKHKPWYIVPADKKWYTRLVVSEVLLEVLKDIGPEFPVLTEKQEMKLEEAGSLLTE